MSSGTADAINTNQRLRQRIAHGFRELGLASEACAVERVPALLLQERVDLLLITGSIADPNVDLSWLVGRAQRQQTRVAFWLHDDPYEFDLHWRLDGLDCPVFSNEPNCLPYYPASCQPRALALAASPSTTCPGKGPPTKRQRRWTWASAGWPFRNGWHCCASCWLRASAWPAGVMAGRMISAAR